MKTEYSHKKIFSYFETESLKYNNKQTNDILYIIVILLEKYLYYGRNASHKLCYNDPGELMTCY